MSDLQWSLVYAVVIAVLAFIACRWGSKDKSSRPPPRVCLLLALLVFGIAFFVLQWIKSLEPWG